MRFVETPLAGAWVIELERLEDERGWFARTWDRALFAAHGLDPEVSQTNSSYNRSAGTLRGLHYQADPHWEAKLVRCTRGSVFDVIVDLRPESPTHRRWFGLELSADNDRTLFIPAGMAHGFQTLVDECEVHYQMGHEYVADSARGVRWDDPAFGIEWPAAPPGRVISQRDASYADYRP